MSYNSIEYKDRKLSLEPNRGYYSECSTSGEKCVATDLPEDITNIRTATIHRMYGWQLKTDRSVLPVDHELQKSRCESRLAPAQRWIKYPGRLAISFPIQTIKPKVQLLLVAPPGQLPREVEVERRRRKYAKLNIQEMLKSAGIEMWRLVPISVFHRYLTDEEKFDKFSTKIGDFPLEWFDDDEYDCMTPWDWLNLGICDGDRHPIPGEAYLPNRFLDTNAEYDEYDPITLRNYLYMWTKVAVQEYNPKTKLWLVTDISTKTTYQIPRIYLMFIAENPEDFICRVKKALNSRELCERYLKFGLIVDCMIMKGIPDANDKIKAKIDKLVLDDNPRMKYLNSEWINKLQIEVKFLYQRTLAKLKLVHNMKSNAAEYSFIHLPDEGLKYNFNQPKPLIVSEIENYSEAQYTLSYITLYCMPGVCRAVFKVVSECFKVSEMSLFAVILPKTATLHDFQSIQSTTTTQVIQYLKGFWIENLSGQICLSIRGVGKGGFDIGLSNWEIFKKSKIFRLMELIKYKMQNALRNLVLNSTLLYCNLLCNPCKCLLNVTDDYVWGKDVINSPFKPNELHVFTLVLHMEGNEVFYSTHPDSFKPIIIKLFDDSIRQTHFIHQINPMVMTSLVFANDLYLSSVGLLEPIIIERRELLLLCYERAVVPLKAYSMQFLKFTKFFNLNIDNFLQSMIETEKTSQDIKEEISLQIRLKENVERTLPMSIQIGPFLINVDPLKQFLLSKHQELTDKLLNMLAERLRNQTLKIIDCYKHIMKRLCEKSSSIEYIFNSLAWMKEIPEIVKGHEEWMRTTLFEYEILDFFWYSLSLEDFRIKWEAVAWPLKIIRQIEMTKEVYEEDSEIFKKNQFNELTTFDERVEALNVQVSSYATQYDYLKAIEFSIDIKKTWKNILDLLEHGKLLNKRQILFEIQEIDLTDLENLMENFQPYKTLWVTAADFIKSEEAWCGNPLTNVDVVVVKKGMSEYKADIERCIEIFKELPKVQSVANQFLSDIEKFEPCVRVIEYISNPCWILPYWQELIKTTGMEFKFNLNINFQLLIEKGILQHEEYVRELSERATFEKETLDAEAAEAERVKREEEERIATKKRIRMERSDLF